MPMIPATARREGRSKLSWLESKHNCEPSRAVDIAPYPIDWDDRERFSHLVPPATADRRWTLAEALCGRADLLTGWPARGHYATTVTSISRGVTFGTGRWVSASIAVTRSTPDPGRRARARR